MDILPLVVSGLVGLGLGLALGVGLAYLLFQRRLQPGKDVSLSDADPMRLVWEEKLKARDERAFELEARLSELKAESAQLREENSRQRSELSALEARLSEEKRNAAEKLKLLDEAQGRLADTFKGLSSEALKDNSKTFLDMARLSLEKYQESARGDLEKRQTAIDTLVKPLRESLEKVDKQVRDLEEKRAASFAGLTTQLQHLNEAQGRLQMETGNLVRALSRPNVRGRWGEVFLQRAVELAGMLEYCDFQQQASTATEDGARRPDMIIRLPNRRIIVVDSKAPLEAYLAALEAGDDESRIVKMKLHAAHVRNHLGMLSQKKYWEQLESSPEFVVLFLPGENFFSSALEYDPQLLEEGIKQQVIVATPTTLIALLKAVHYGWQQEEMTRDAREISKMGKSLYERVETFASHYVGMRKALNGAVEAYNKSVSSLESRFLPAARRFKELVLPEGEEMQPLEAIDEIARAPQAEELIALPPESLNRLNGP